jgi:drug/metabolite transporter (DMT)-like permease
MSDAAEVAGTLTPGPAPASSGAPVPLLRAYLSVGAATFFWSSNVVAVKYILRDIPAVPAAMMRVILAALTLASIRWVQRRPLLPQRGDGAALLWLGVIGIAGSFTMFTSALAWTSIAHTVFIGALTPIVVLVLARLQGQERFTASKLAGLAVCLVGVILLAIDRANGTTASLTGDVMAFIGVCCFAFFMVTSKRLAPRYDSVSLISYAFGVGALFLFPFLLWFGPAVDWEQIRWTAWLGLSYSSTIGSVGAYLTFYYALRSLAASQVAAFQYVQPVLATCFGVLFLAETWGAGFVVGAALILIGILLAERR